MSVRQSSGGTAASFKARSAVRALETARRDNRRRQIDVWEAIYQAYLAGFSVLAVMALGFSLLPSQPVSDGTASWLAGRGRALIGLLVAAAVTTGLRSGSSAPRPIMVSPSWWRHTSGGWWISPAGASA